MTPKKKKLVKKVKKSAKKAHEEEPIEQVEKLQLIDDDEDGLEGLSFPGSDDEDLRDDYSDDGMGEHLKTLKLKFFSRFRRRRSSANREKIRGSRQAEGEDYR